MGCGTVPRDPIGDAAALIGTPRPCRLNGPDPHLDLSVTELVRSVIMSDRSTTSDATRSAHAIPSLDGVRAASILFVFLGHAHVPHVEGSVGVTVFFFLSGYLITTLLRLEQEKSGRIALGQFYLRRIFRILPPLYVTLIAIVVLDRTGILGGPVGLPGVAAAALNGANYVEASGHGAILPRGSGIFWSVAVEEHFYLIFPLLYIALLRTLRTPNRQAVVLAGLCLAITCWRTVLAMHFHADWQWIHYATDSRADSILLGCLLAITANPYLDEVRIPQSVAVWFAVPLGAILLVAPDHLLPPALRTPLDFDVQALGLMLVFTAIIRYPTHGVARVLNARPVAYLGVLSYGFYLVHRLFQIPLQESLHAGRAETILISFPLSCLASWLLHIGVELPSARVRRRLSASPRIPWTFATRVSPSPSTRPAIRA